MKIDFVWLKNIFNLILIHYFKVDFLCNLLGRLTCEWRGARRAKLHCSSSLNKQKQRTTTTKRRDQNEKSITTTRANFKIQNMIRSRFSLFRRFVSFFFWLKLSHCPSAAVSAQTKHYYISYFSQTREERNEIRFVLCACSLAALSRFSFIIKAVKNFSVCSQLISFFFPSPLLFPLRCIPINVRDFVHFELNRESSERVKSSAFRSIPDVCSSHEPNLYPESESKWLWRWKT